MKILIYGSKGWIGNQFKKFYKIKKLILLKEIAE